jgi:hypothetical protein
MLSYNHIRSLQGYFIVAFFLPYHTLELLTKW